MNAAPAPSAQRPPPAGQGVAVGVLRAGVRTYQWTLRPFLGSHCRFHPSCSEFALEALSVHGALRGSAMAAGRILRCNPWHPGGYDPVPPPRRPVPAAASEG
jgi:hypothetical protein